MAIAVTNNNPKPKVKPSLNDDEVKRKGWSTPYGFIDTKEPVTYNEACRISAEVANTFNEIGKEFTDRDE